ncbi:FecR family protein [Pseudomonas flavescens]|uniref:FecR family protein n=1 Tax=Phytopseudomonas flavescens TaxID=29435 RepID=A0A1G8C196_9GAMM|nr:DUF4880 domain-containing protein [Pseudomonas flavescens]SDH39103.1 FecR family protein [Pseudomonas flavescens]
MTPAIEQAIEWHARQSSGSFDEQQRRYFQQWLQADPSHAEAWRELQGRLGRTLPALAGGAARKALDTPRNGRRAFLRGALVLGGLALGAHVLEQPGLPLANWRADLRTTTGERRRLALPDGSTLTLNARSAVDLPGQRRLTLLGGGLQIDVAALPAQPFQLACPFGEVHLSSGRCLLELQDEFALFWLLDGEARVSAFESQWHLLKGQGVRLDAGGLQLLHAATARPDAWTRGLLEARDLRLDEVIGRLRPYHRGILQLSARAADLRISGVFSLDDSEHALRALQDVLPLKVERYLGIWTRIDHA